MRAEELTALINARPGKLFKLVTALGFVVGALGVTGRSALARGRVDVRRHLARSVTGLSAMVRRAVTSAEQRFRSLPDLAYRGGNRRRSRKRLGEALPRRLLILVGCVIASAALCAVAVVAQGIPPLPAPWWTAIASIALVAASRLLAMQLRIGTNVLTIDWAEAALILTLILVGPAWTITTVALGVAVALGHRMDTLKYTYNVTTSVVSAAAAALVLSLAKSPAEPFALQTIVLLVIGVVLASVVSDLAVAAAVAFSRSAPLGDVLVDRIGVKVAALAVNVGIAFAVIAVIAVIAVARYDVRVLVAAGRCCGYCIRDSSHESASAANGERGLSCWRRRRGSTARMSTGSSPERSAALRTCSPQTPRRSNFMSGPQSDARSALPAMAWLPAWHQAWVCILTCSKSPWRRLEAIAWVHSDCSTSMRSRSGSESVSHWPASRIPWRRPYAMLKR